MAGICIIPYRDREEHLKTFIPHFNDYTKNQFHIFVIEQEPGKQFNRAKLFNVGVHHINERFKLSPDDYFILHDVDMLPVIAYYSKPAYPTHIATQCSQFGYKMPVPDYFGGVVLIQNQHYKAVNGMSNIFWGWGAEDEEFRNRLKRFRIQRRNCRFESLPHPIAIDWKEYYQKIKTVNPLPEEYVTFQKNKQLSLKPDPKNDGLSTVDYQILQESKFMGASKITVSI